jgi:hypothetical protein
LSQLGQLYKENVKALVLEHRVFRARFAAPLTQLGFPALIPTFRSPIEGLSMASMCHVYPDERSVNNSVRVAAELVRELGFADVADSVPMGRSLAAKYGKILL